MCDRYWTLVVMAVSVLLLIGWDIVVAFYNDTPNEEDTISGVLQGWFKIGIWPLAWAWGGLGSHLFRPGVFWTQPTSYSISALVLSGIGLLLLGLWASPRISQTRARVALRGLGLMMFGILEGWLFFPQ